jgi:hypothetical protein
MLGMGVKVKTIGKVQRPHPPTILADVTGHRYEARLAKLADGAAVAVEHSGGGSAVQQRTLVSMKRTAPVIISSECTSSVMRARH